MPGLSQAQIDTINGNLRAAYFAQVAHVTDKWHVPFSGQPQQDLGALKIAFDDAFVHLNAIAPQAMSGEKAQAYLDLANTLAKTIREIGDYDDQTDITTGITYSLTAAPDWLPNVKPNQTLWEWIKAQLPSWLLPGLVVLALVAGVAVVVGLFVYVRGIWRSVQP